MNSGLRRRAFRLSALLVSRIGTHIPLPPGARRAFLGNNIGIVDLSHCDRGRAADLCGPRIGSEYSDGNE
ncbi:MAG: hypothetical protein J2P54_17850 [Bradyrhizobiaceae bacterium]|nr:hypothetical protein [Bradyrhizobiaceae bacterium]